jgi:hypothetical protein
MEVKNAPTLKDYLAGAVLANSLSWLMLGAAPSLGVDPLIYVQLLLLTYICGAIMAGYLVARKAFQHHMRVGLRLGLGSFVFHIYVFMGVVELVTGQRMLGLFDHLLILALFICGGLIGSLLRRQFSSVED